MRLRGLIDEDFVNYKEPSMFIIFPYCTFKCDVENGTKVCQNGELINLPIIDINETTLACRYLSNNITKAIVCGGLEPIDSFNDLLEFIIILRECFHNEDPIIIYTGYAKDEIFNELDELKKYKNIIIKFGRYVPNQQSHYDEVLGINLASNNQYAEKIS